ncbi:hypothetical protein [Sphingomonas colocasiae]|uniref:DUF768 domain-containing protein n=1 Tax=Sphingomonas colocasiae TaxID=1848973 RepID=A0ABS7PP24_9SPHN|nr:hypothetical protein [Sphingomonas colocasiae]MBY8823070.1 hypothetical protein [Sphingomonas colocasiae]
MAQAGIDLEELQELAVAELGEDVRTEAIDLAAGIIAHIADMTIPDDETAA